MDFRSALRKARANPRLAARALSGRARGMYYRLKFRLLGRRVVIGRRFSVYGALDIRGPGLVVFGDDCTVMSSRLAPTTPYTTSPEAVIRFGNEVILSGTRLSCQARIEVGDRAGIGEARVMDSDFHELEPSGIHRSKTRGPATPVIIGPNTWIAVGAIVLKGVRVGENSIVGAGAVVTGEVPANVIVFGNPARTVWWFTARGHDGGPEASRAATPSLNHGLREEAVKEEATTSVSVR